MGSRWSSEDPVIGRVSGPSTRLMVGDEVEGRRPRHTSVAPPRVRVVAGCAGSCWIFAAAGLCREAPWGRRVRSCRVYRYRERSRPRAAPRDLKRASAPSRFAADFPLGHGCGLFHTAIDAYCRRRSDHRRWLGPSIDREVTTQAPRPAEQHLCRVQACLRGWQAGRGADATLSPWQRD